MCAVLLNNEKNKRICSMLNTILSLRQFPGVDIEVIDILVQITHQRNRSNAKYHHKKTHETLLSHKH